MELRYALAEVVVEATTTNAHMIELAVVITNLGIIVVTAILATVTWKLHKTTMAEISSAADRNAATVDNAIDSMEKVATRVVDHTHRGS